MELNKFYKRIAEISNSKDRHSDLVLFLLKTKLTVSQKTIIQKILAKGGN